MPYAATRTAVKKNTQTKKAPRRRFRIFSQSLQLFPWLELQQLLNKKPARAACPWLSLLDTVCGRDPLPIGPSTKSTWPPPRNVVGWLFVRKSESLEHETSAGAIDFGLGQRTSACGIVPGFVFPSAEPVPAGGRRARVQFQEPASFAQRNCHHSVCRDLGVGQVPWSQEGGKVSFAAGSRRFWTIPGWMK